MLLCPLFLKTKTKKHQWNLKQREEFYYDNYDIGIVCAQVCNIKTAKLHHLLPKNVFKNKNTNQTNFDEHRLSFFHRSLFLAFLLMLFIGNSNLPRAFLFLKLISVNFDSGSLLFISPTNNYLYFPILLRREPNPRAQVLKKNMTNQVVFFSLSIFSENGSPSFPLFPSFKKKVTPKSLVCREWWSQNARDGATSKQLQKISTSPEYWLHWLNTPTRPGKAGWNNGQCSGPLNSAHSSNCCVWPKNPKHEMSKQQQQPLHTSIYLSIWLKVFSCLVLLALPLSPFVAVRLLIRLLLSYSLGLHCNNAFFPGCLSV